MKEYLNLLVQVLLIISLLIVAFFLLKIRNTLRKEKRLTRFSIDAITDKQLSFFDKFERIYEKIIHGMSKFLKNFTLLINYSKKYDIYVDQTQIIRQDSMDFISHKFCIAFITLIITLFSDILRVQNITILQLFLCSTIGFFLPDIFLYFEKKSAKRRIENDLFKAVTIMNNAFKSGRSIMQAVELVYTELDGPISDEFKKMFIDLNYGLELEVVFNRFANRVQLDEIKYMASSLVILNKTGGNIVKVFNTIERGFFDRKKLKQELKSATALSDLVFKVLIMIPIFIFVMVYLFNTDYYKPLFTTIIGKIIFIIILLIYIIYILIVKKVTKLEE